MDANTANQEKENIQYSRMFSSLFCSMSILALSMLCLLNNMTLDLYTTSNLLMIVVPGSICFWVLGYIMGKILDTKQKVIVKKKKINEQLAYEIPSMFNMTESANEEFGEL